MQSMKWTDSLSFIYLHFGENCYHKWQEYYENVYLGADGEAQALRDERRDSLIEICDVCNDEGSVEADIAARWDEQIVGLVKSVSINVAQSIVADIKISHLSYRVDHVDIQSLD